MQLASHNSWSYLKPKKWWMKALAFTAKCQAVPIKEQYEQYGVRCFDLRVKFDGGVPVVVHNIIEYELSEHELADTLYWLDAKGDVYVRVLLDIRNEKGYTAEQRGMFVDFCYDIERAFKKIKFWCGRTLYDWSVLYEFKNNPSCEEKYSSVCPPKIIDDWWPYLFAKKNNKRILQEGTDKDFLMIDFVNIN